MESYDIREEAARIIGDRVPTDVLEDIVARHGHNYVLLVDRDASTEPAVPFGAFSTVDEALEFAEDFREANGLPRRATPVNNEKWTEAGWYFGIFELRTAVERWA